MLHQSPEILAMTLMSLAHSAAMHTIFEDGPDEETLGATVDAMFEVLWRGLRPS